MYRSLFSGLLVCLGLLLCGSKALAVTYYTYINGGSTGPWASASTWTTDPSGLSLTGSAIPTDGDAVVILNGFTVTLSANITTIGHSITIRNGGTLDLSTFTITTINTLSGSGTVKIGASYFPAITTNNFVNNAAAGATVQYYDFTGTLPVSVNYPNLLISNSTAANNTITFSNASAYSFTIDGNLVTQATGTGTLTVTIGNQITNIINLTVGGNITIGTNTSWRVGAFNTIHTITSQGNMTNNGTVDFSNGTQYAASTTGAANITFTGTTNNTLACNGVTDLYTLTVNKGSSSTYILSVTSTNVANLNFYANTQLIIITNGTLRLGANINITRLYGSGSTNYDVGFTDRSPMLWIDGATVNSNGSALVIYGKFRMTAGSFTTLGGEGSVIRAEGQYIIEGGTFTTEKFRPSTTAETHRGSFIMSGGTFNASGTGSTDSYARFSLPYPEQVFIMSGGTINVSNPEETGTAINGGIHIGCNASTYNVTGGTFNAILSGTASFFNIASTVPFWNLNVSRTGGTPTTVRLNAMATGVTGTTSTAQPLVVLNNFSIDGTNTPIFNANGLNVTIGKHFTIATNGTYTPSANTTTFNGTGDQDFINSGTITSGLYNLTVNKPSGAVILGGAVTTYTVSHTLTLLSGILNDGGKILQVAGDIYSETIHTGTGNITLNGTGTQTFLGDGAGVFGNIVLNNASIPGARATCDVTISGTLTLAGTGNSLFDIAENQLALTSTSSSALTTTGNGFSASKMIRTSGFHSDRGLRKTFGNLSAFTFAVGTGTHYTPAIFQLTSAPTAYGTIAVRPAGYRHQFIVAGNTNNLSCYWKVTSAGFTGLGATAVSHTYQYEDSSVSPGGDDVNYIPARYNPTSWTATNDVTKVDETANLVYFTGVGYIDGEFTAGVPASFGVVRIFYSKRNGNWTDVSAGTTPWSNVSHSGPDASVAPAAGDQVYIGDGATFNHTVVITTNSLSSGGLEINLGSTLDVGTTTGHNFGTFENTHISGSGTLRISSATATAEFPAGDFGNFIRASGGTVEYYTTGTTDFTIPLNSSAPTVLPLISYRHLAITPASGRSITMPNQDERIYGNMTVQGTSASGMARLNIAASSRSLIVNGNLLVNSGNLQLQNVAAQTIQIDGNISVGANAMFDIASSGSATNLLTLEGNLVNNGILDFSNTATRVCNATFAGITNASITGSGSVMDFNILTVAKGTSQSTILEVNASAFTLSGATLPLVLSTGTFRLTSAQTVTFANGADFTIPAAARLSANGGTLQLTGNDGIDLLLAGTLEVLNGTINAGTTNNDNSVEYAATGQPTITSSGGSLNIRSQIRRSFASTQGGFIYNQSGGIVSVALNSSLTVTRGVMEMLNSGSSFTMSGGTLRIIRASGSSAIADLYLQPSSFSVSGGTIEIGTGVTGQTVDINSTIPLYNLTVSGTGTNVAHLEANGLTLRGTLTIEGGQIFNASGLNVSIAGNLVNSNTNNSIGTGVGGYRAGTVTQTTTFNSSTNNQTITGLSGNLTNFGNLVINNSFAGGTVALQPNTNLYVNGALTLTNGTLASAANIITAIGTVSNSATHTSTTSGSITLAGSSNQTITGNGNGKFGNLTLNNGTGATLSANQEVTETLTLTSGTLNINSNALVLSNTSMSAIVGASSARYIITSGNLSDAGVTKAFAASATGNFIFPIGVGSKYTPANYTITTGGTGGTITITPVGSKHPNATGSGTAYIRYYWNVTQSSAIIISSLTHTYTYVAADESGNTADYRDARFKGGAWTIGVTAGNPDITNRIITFTNTDVAGDYSAGEATAFVNPTTYTSIGDGNWESDGVWSVDPPGTNLGPPPGSFVIISALTTVTVTSNSKQTATLEINGRLHLASTTGHDFGTVTTTGAGARTMQLQSSTFPAGNFTAFTMASGGTVEYDGNVVLPTRTTYNNISFTGAGLKTLPNADLTINGNFTVHAGTVTNAVSNKNITLVSTTGDFTNNSFFNAGSGAIVVGRNLVNSGSGATFISSTGTAGLRISGNLTNISSATFTMASDSLGVRGTLTNSATFNAGSGAIRVSQNFNNTGGTFTGSTGIVSVSGSMTNNATYSAGSGATTVSGTYTNTGASAIHHLNGSSLAITGNFTNSTSGVFNGNTGTVSVGGGWNNSATFNAGTGSITFNSASGRTLTGTTTFYNLTRTGGGSLTLNNSIGVSNTLTLSGGNITTGSNIVTLSNTASQPVSGYSASSFIDGRLAISYPNTAGTSRIYPVGKGAIYRPVTIVQTAASTLPTVSVEMINTPPTGSYPMAVGILSEARYYAINQTSGTMNSPTVELYFNTNGSADENVLVPGNVHIMKAANPAGPWTDEGGSGVFAPLAPAGYATSGVTTFSNPTYFTLGYQNVPLPITLGSFDAVFGNDVVELEWTTYTETNNAFFTIERSKNGIKFDSIGFVEGTGNSRKKLLYHEVDSDPLSGASYYRLKQTDYDLNYSYSHIVRVYNSRPNKNLVNVYPNPAELSTPLFIRMENENQAQAFVQITSTSGVINYSSNVDLSSPIDVNNLNMRFRLERGVYFVSVTAAGIKETKKVIIR